MSFSGAKGYQTKPPAGVRINPLHPLSRGLVGCWLFNEMSGSRAADISGHGNHGTLKNMSPNAQNSGWGGSKFGGGLQFDGVDDYVGVGTPLSATSGTISFWMNMPDVTVDGRPISDTGGYWYLKMYAGGALRFEIFDDAGRYTPYIYLTGRDGEWIHVTGVWGDSGYIRLYVDGVLIGSTVAGSIGNVAHDIRIGGDTGDFTGSIDSVRIYNRALSAAEVKQLYYDPFCNLLRVPVRYVSAAAGLPIPVAMNHYRRRRVT